MKIVWKPGYHSKGVSAQTAYDVINGLYEKGKMEASDLVDASRPEDAPLHSLFEWNDSIAAEKYREDQARYIIRHVCVVQEDEENESAPVRAFFQIDNESSTYEPTLVIMNDEEKYERLLDIAKRELKAFENKYRQLEELRNVFDAIDELIKEA